MVSRFISEKGRSLLHITAALRDSKGISRGRSTENIGKSPCN